MAFSGRSKNTLGGVGLFATALLVSTRPADDAPATPIEQSSEQLQELARIDDEGASVLADGGPRADPGGTAASRSPGPLRGITGAATALTIGDPALSLQLLDDVDRGDPGSETWFSVGAMRGRALRRVGRHADAIAAFEEIAGHKRTKAMFPFEILVEELARARLGLAASGTLSVADADHERREAIRELAAARRLKTPVRNELPMRVLQVEAMAQIEGTSPHASKVAASKAASALAKIITELPNHPDDAAHRLLHAQLLERAGKLSEAAEAYRRVTIEQAGEPEEAQAWAELERLAASSRKVRVRPLLITERLEQAKYARFLRRVERSREILDEIIADPDTPPFLRKEARHSRSFTAYKQRDFEVCADDLRPEYEETGNHELEDRIVRCLERGEKYDEAIDIELKGTKTSKRGLKAAAYWRALDLAFRAGQYERTESLLDQYDKLSNANRGERAWLRAWLAYRLGRDEEAIDLFDKVKKRSPKDATRARYFRGKLMLAAKDPETRAEGVTSLQQLAISQGWSYYGLQARQRLVDAGEEPGPLPELVPVQDEDDRPSRADTTTLLRQLDDSYGDAWPPIRRMRQLYAAGYLEEARRELRVATTAFLGLSTKVRSEALQEGLGWRAQWKFPSVRPTKKGRKTLRDREAKAELSDGLRKLSLALDEPSGWARLVPSSEATRTARWHPRAFRAPIEREARVRKVDPIHLWSLMYTESRFRRHVVSPVGARGALQIMPWTGFQLAERLGELDEGRFDSDTLFDIDTNSHLATYYISELLAKFHGQPAMAYASYNGGPSNVERWLKAKAKHGSKLELDTFIEEMVFTESYRYAKRVMEVSAAYAMLYEGKLPRWTNAVDPVVEDNIAF